MKKFQRSFHVMLFVLTLALTGLSGCQIFSGKQAEEGDIDHTPRDRRIGVIQSLGTVKTSSQGTNLLTMDDGGTILLKSLAINLDDAKYASKKVEVSGVLTYTTDGKQIMEVESIDILDEAPVTQQITAVAWRDYINAGLGFRVKYRDDFLVQQNGDMITFKRPVDEAALSALMAMTQEGSTSMEVTHDHTITISAATHGSDQTLVQDVLKLKDDSSSALMAAGYTMSRIGLDGIEAYKKVSADGKSIIFHFDADGRFYTVSYEGGMDSQSLEDQNIFFDFLASFQLLSGSSAVTGGEDDTVNNLPVTSTTTAGSTGSGSVGVAIGNADEDFTETDEPSSTEPAMDEPAAPSSTEPAAASSSGSETQELLTGYSSFVSTGYKFTLQYPKSWYYGQTSSSDSDVVRRYDFGTKPVDEEPGSVYLDIVSGSVPSGTTMTVNGNQIVKTFSGATVTYYYKSDNGRTYRVSGPSSMDTSLKNMISTIEEQ
jgi:hypothetical protein